MRDQGCEAVSKAVGAWPSLWRRGENFGGVAKAVGALPRSWGQGAVSKAVGA